MFIVTFILSFILSTMAHATPIENEAVQIAAGDSHSLAIKEDGSVWAWGNNYYGQLGDGSTTNKTNPVLVAGLSNVAMIAAGDAHSLALKVDGSVWAWGRNNYGQLGNGSTTNKTSPFQVAGLSNVAMIAAGSYHSLALKDDGSVWVWGYNGFGQLGDGSNTNKSSPVQVPGLSSVSMIASGNYHSLAIKDDTSVCAWGYNRYGQLGDGSTTNKTSPVHVAELSNVVMITAGRHLSLGLKDDGSVWAWGYNYYGQLGDGSTTNKTSPVQVSGLSNVLMIASGDSHSLGLKDDGSVWAWGINGSGQLGDGSTTNKTNPVQLPGLSNVAMIAAGFYNSLAIKDDGSVWAWGINNSGQLGDGSTTNKSSPVQMPGLSNVAMIAAGFYHSLATKKDSTVWAWGKNSHGQLGDGSTITKSSPVPVQVPGLSNVAMIAVRDSHNLALKDDSSVVLAWGNNYYGQLGDGSTITKSSPVQVQGLSNVLMIASGGSHSLGLKDDGSVWTWGWNHFSQLGDGSTTHKSSPVQVPGLSNIAIIAAGSSHSLALKDDGTVWAWGYNNAGQLGDGSATNKSSPVQVSGLSNVAMIAAGSLHSLALKDDGSVWAWGFNNYGQLGDGSTTSQRTPVQAPGLSNVVMIAAGDAHSLALKDDGSVWTLGLNNYGQLGDGSCTSKSNPVQVPGLSNVAMIAAGFFHSLALKNDGTVWAWGLNRDYQLGHGSTHLPEPVFSPIKFISKTMTTSPNNTISIPVINTAQQNITLSFSTTDETAIAGIDYLTTSGSLTFQANESQKDIRITILNNPDSLHDKTFVLNMNTSDDIFLNDGSQIIITISFQHTVNSPYTETFSQNMPGSGWTYNSSTPNGRIQTTAERLRMDTDTDQVQNLNEAILHFNLSYMDSVQLNFFQKSIASDICTSLPETYTDHFNGDGVSISNDSYTWYSIMDCTDLITDAFGKNYTINLRATESIIQSNYNENFHLNRFVQIKFQQYGKRTYPFGGKEWDNISINGTIIPSPVAHNDILYLTEDIETTSLLSATQESGNPLNYTIVTPPNKGNVTITDSTTGSFTYQPDINETGEDYFTYKAIDLKTEAESKPATITINISPVNDPPVTHDMSVSLDENKYLYIKLSTSDPDNNTLTYQIIEPPLHGTVSLMNNIATYTPHIYYNGPDSFSFKARDEELYSNISSVMLTIYSVYSPPLAYPQNVNTTEDMPVNISLTGFSPDNLPLTYHLNTQASHGTISGIPPHLTYTPAPHFWGNDAFTFFVNDGEENSESAQISIFIARSENYTLSLLTNKAGQIRINGTTVLPPWNNPFPADAQVCFEAIPNVDWIFQQWTGDSDSAQNPICITMDRSKTITANFVKQSFVLNIYGNETIMINQQEQQLPFRQSFEIHSNMIIQTNSNRFRCWDGDIQLCDDLIEFTINEHMNLTPIFYPIPIWETPITVERQVADSSVQYTGTIHIGIASQAYTKPLKTTAEFYSCDIFAYDQDLETVGDDIHQDNLYEHIWNIAVSPRGNIGSVVNEETAAIRWNPQTFSPEGHYILKKGLDGTGETLIENMRNTTQYLITDKTYQGLSIVWKKYDTFTFHLNQGWNLISLPLIPETTTVENLFPDYTVAYEYKNGGYLLVSALEPGKGYWIKVPNNSDYTVEGDFFSNDTISLTAGWHLIGASNQETTPISDTDSIAVIFQYETGAYVVKTTLEPGLGYWIKMIQEGELKIVKE